MTSSSSSSGSAHAHELHAHHRRAVSLMLLSAGCFTANVLIVRAIGAMPGANLWLVSCTRFVVGLIAIAIVYRREWAPMHLVRHGTLIGRGVVGGAGVYVTYATVVALGAGRATFIGNSYLIWGALLAAWVLKETLRPAVMVACAAALVGIALLTHVFSSTSDPGLYDLLAIVGALMSAYVIVAIRQLHGTEHTSTIYASQCLYGLIICAVPAAVTFAPLPAGAWALMILAGGAAGVGQLTMTRAFRDLSVAEGSLLQMVVPLGVAVGGVAFFGERYTRTDMLGAALVLGGAAVTVVRRPARITPPVPADTGRADRTWPVP